MSRPRSVVDISPPHTANGKIHLTYSEYRMLGLLRRAIPIREIMAETGWSSTSVYVYIRNLSEKLDVSHGRLGIATYGATWDDSQFSIAPERKKHASNYESTERGRRRRLVWPR